MTASCTDLCFLVLPYFCLGLPYNSGCGRIEMLKRAMARQSVQTAGHKNDTRMNVLRQRNSKGHDKAAADRDENKTGITEDERRR